VTAPLAATDEVRSKSFVPPAFFPKQLKLDQRRVAVLPLQNISPDTNDEYLADGLTEELISTISRVRELSVISSTSAMQYKTRSKPVVEIGRELNAGTILEGSVRKAASKIRITIQMIDAMHDKHLWAESYDRELQDIFAIQSDIAERVAEALRIQLLSTEKKDIERKAPGNAEAYPLYLKGRYFWNQRELDGFKKALELFQQAIEKDPAFAPAYAGLADTHLLLGRNGHVSPKFAYPRAIEYAEKALSLDGSLPEPHVALAAIRQEYEWKWEEAENEFKRAIESNPSYAIAHIWYSLYLGHVGRLHENIEQAERAQELDPLSPRIHCGASEAYLFARLYDRAIDAAETALEINREFGGAYGYRAYAYVEKAMYDKAISDFQQAGRMQGARAWMGRLGHAYAASGKFAEAKKILDELASESDQSPPRSPFIPPPPTTAFDTALVYLGLGEKEKAVDWLEKAADERTAEIIHIKCEPIYDSVRENPRFIALMKRIGLDR